MDMLIQDEEVRLIKAVGAYRGGEASSMKKAAQEWSVSYKKLQRRLRGARARRMNGGLNKHFSLTQEKVLTDWMDRLIGSGFPPRLDFLRDRANLLLKAQRNESDVAYPTAVGKNWPSNFVARHPQYKTCGSAPLDLARARSTTRATLDGWFHRFKGAQHEFGVTGLDIYNVDETGFQTRTAQRTKLINWKTTAPDRAFALHAGDRTWITSIECIGTNGRVLPPLVILPGQLHQSTWYRTNIPSDWHLATSETGWTNDNLALKWLEEVFDPTTRPWTVGTHRLLILDGHGSHVTAEFILSCWRRQIVPLCLPPHTSHLLQPLDVSCFSPLKHYHSLAVLNTLQRGDVTFDKVEFLSQFPRIRTLAFHSRNIESAFRTSGLVPFRPSVVLSQLPPSPRPITPPRPNEVALHQTPRTLRQVQMLGQHLLSELGRDIALDLTLEPLHRQLTMLLKVTETSFSRVALQEKELTELHKAAQSRALKASRRRNYLQDGGVLRVDRAMELIEQKEAKERTVEEGRQRRAAKRAGRAAQAGMDGQS